MFFVVLNIFLAILNDAYTVVHTQNIWEELEKRKPLSLREKFEVRRAMWRERRNIARINKMKREKAKEEKNQRKEYEKRIKEKRLMDRIGKKTRKGAVFPPSDGIRCFLRQSAPRPDLSDHHVRRHNNRC